MRSTAAAAAPRTDPEIVRAMAAEEAAADGAALRPVSPGRVRAIAIGSSTGGPQALRSLLGQICGWPAPPILIAQHMPPNFTGVLAGHLARAAGRPCVEGTDGAPLVDGAIYVAPGGRHMTVQRRDEGVVVALTDDAPENFCRPSVDPLLRGMVAAFGPEVLAVMLTGMGRDGLEGARAVVSAGGNVIAQDEATSVAWGMPGAVATAGLCCAVLPIDELGGEIKKMAGGSPP
jgi:two-component system chemotaxis response regulator CheB